VPKNADEEYRGYRRRSALIDALKQVCCSLTTRRRKLAETGTYAAVDKVTRTGSAQTQGVGNCYGDAVIDEVDIEHGAVRRLDHHGVQYAFEMDAPVGLLSVSTMAA